MIKVCMYESLLTTALARKEAIEKTCPFGNALDSSDIGADHNRDFCCKLMNSEANPPGDKCSHVSNHYHLPTWNVHPNSCSR